MNNIIIKNSTVTINTIADTISVAKDKLLAKLFYARNKNTMGGYDAWLDLLDMYYSCDYEGMYEHIQSCNGYGGKTRNECLKYLNVIMEGEE